MTPDVVDYLTSPTCWAIFLGCFAATTVLTPLVIAFAHWLGGIEKAGYRKIHLSPTPLLGGLAISIPFILVALACLSQTTGMFHVIHGRMWDLVVLAVGSVGITLLGIVDDVRGMRARHKLLGQILIATMVAGSGFAITAIKIPLFGVISLDHIFGLGTLLTILWIVGITNAVNIIDGMDGLASGVSLISALSLGTIAALNGNPFVVLLCIALSGSLLAFLRYNWHPAQIFLGDTGSMFLGFVLATVSLMGAYKSQGAVLLMGAVMALGIPIFETFISMLRRFVAGFPIFMADSRHTHHRLLRRGMTQHQVAMMLYVGGLLCFGASVLSVISPSRSFESLISVAIFLVTLLSIAVIAGYTTTMAVKFRRRQETLRRLAFAKYASTALVPGAPAPSVLHVMDLMCSEFSLNFAVVLFAEGTRRIASSGLPENPAIIVHPHSVERFRVKASDNSPVEVIYQHDHDAGYIEKHIVASCLANIFEGINANLPTEIVGPSKGDELRTPSVAS